MPRWPYRLRRSPGRDGVTRSRGGVLERFMHVDRAPLRARAWQTRDGFVHIRAESIDPGVVDHPDELAHLVADHVRKAGEPELDVAIERIRFSLAVEEKMGDFYETFKRDPLLGPTIHQRPWVRPRRRPWPWEALCWAITEQLIEGSRAAAIQRRIVRRWAPSHLPADHPPPRARRDPWPLRDVPSATVIAGRAPAELASMDLSQGRSVAMVRCAREVARGRAHLDDPSGDRRLLEISEIGPWTIQCLGLHGRGDPDSLPAGDLAYVKLVGRLAGLGRRATEEEVRAFFERYAPFQALAGTYLLMGRFRPAFSP